MNRIRLKSHKRLRRKKGLRKRLMGYPGQPRLSVFRSAKHIYAQVIDDLSGKTLASASTNEKAAKDPKGGNCGAATQVGTRLAERAKAAGVDAVVFDRGGNKYHGRVAAIADGAREGGLSL